jgi:hypothetical protein
MYTAPRRPVSLCLCVKKEVFAHVLHGPGTDAAGLSAVPAAAAVPDPARATWPQLRHVDCSHNDLSLVDASFRCRGPPSRTLIHTCTRTQTRQVQ